MELDLEGTTLLWTGVLTGCFLFGLWFIKLGGGGLDLKTRILVSIFSPFLTYGIIVMMKNKWCKMEKKYASYLWKTLKVLIFLSFIYTSIIMFRLRNTTTAILIIFAVSFFMIFNKIESMNKRIKSLEERWIVTSAEQRLQGFH